MLNQLKPVSQDYHDGMAQAFRVIEIYIAANGITPEQFNHEKNHWLSSPVQQKTQLEIEKYDIASKAAQTRELNKQLKEANESITNLIEKVGKIPGAFKNLSVSLSAITE